MIFNFAEQMDVHQALVNTFCRYAINNLNYTHLKLEKLFFNQIAVAEPYVNVLQKEGI